MDPIRRTADAIMGTLYRAIRNAIRVGNESVLDEFIGVLTPSVVYMRMDKNGEGSLRGTDAPPCGCEPGMSIYVQNDQRGRDVCEYLSAHLNYVQELSHDAGMDGVWHVMLRSGKTIVHVWIFDDRSPNAPDVGVYSTVTVCRMGLRPAVVGMARRNTEVVRIRFVANRNDPDP